MPIDTTILSHVISGLSIRGRGLSFIVQDTSVTPSFNMFIIDSLTRTVTLKGLLKTDTFLLGGGTVTPPVGIPIYVYENDSDLLPQILVEQDGTGSASLSFLLTGGKQYSMGIDNSQFNDPLKISLGSELGVANKDLLFIDTNRGHIGIGLKALQVVEPNSAANNIAIGNDALTALSTGDDNIGIGKSSLSSLSTTSTNNIAIGNSSGSSLTANSTNNIAIGNSSGSSLTADDSNNILIGSTGALGDNNAIKIGTGGVHSGFIMIGSIISLISVASSSNIIIENQSGGILFSCATMSSDVVIDTNEGQINLSGRIVTPKTATINGPGAINVLRAYVLLDTTGTGDVYSLVDGVAGQRLIIIYNDETAGTDTAVITPTTLLGYTIITLNEIGDSVELLFTANGWTVIGGNNHVSA